MRVLALLLLATVAFASNANWAKFNQFKLKFEKIYPTVEMETERFAIFENNLKEVDRLNSLQKRDKVYSHLTKFMDLTPAEFRGTVLMNNTGIPRRQGSVAPVKPVTALPDTFDWNTKRMLTPVKNQGQCGSCWDFSATETLESVCAIAGYGLHKFSEQQTVDCDVNGQDQGCNGGWPEGAYEYLIGAGGIESEANYPYTAEDGTCAFSAGEVETCKPTKWVYVTQNQDEKVMQQYLFDNSPLSICVDASSWQYYESGVMEAASCTTNIDHCVQATGWQVMSGTKVWNVRNSWATSWGVNGYIYLEYGADTCAMAEHVTVPCVLNTAKPPVLTC